MYIHIKVTPKSKKEVITKVNDTHYEISIKEPAERNMANTRILEIMRELFSGAKQIKIVSGHHSPSKLLSIDVEEN